MEQIVVKTEMQPNGEILLFYVDENAVDANGDQVLHLEEASNYEILEADHDKNQMEQIPIEIEVPEMADHQELPEKWSMEETHKLIVFFIDNKDAFNATTNKQHLWNVACNAIFIGRTVQNCEAKLRNLKRKYSQQRIEHMKGYSISWSLYDLCHQAFHDDKYVMALIRDYEQQQQKLTRLTMPVPVAKKHKTGPIVVKNVNDKPREDDKVETMLKLYLRYKNNDLSPKNLWETIAMELGEDGAEYWHKRFLNYKQHYLRMLPKREISGFGSVQWKYMNLFDQIYGNDPVFQSKYVKNANDNSNIDDVEMQEEAEDWNDTEYTILAKYYFDCFDEFQDTTIPTNFLWTEIGRLLDKKPDICKEKYEEIKNAHYSKYFTGTYTLKGRVPLEIILDNIISQEVEIDLYKTSSVKLGEWTTEEVDQLVNFFYENVELFKDSVCFYVCWACVAKYLNKNITSCKKQWEELKILYKSILQSKMENSEMQIEWRYIDIFDRIFDFGMDTNLLNDFENSRRKLKIAQKVEAHKVKINLDESVENGTDDEEFDERGYTKRGKRALGDSKAFKILDYYQKNKEKFATSQKKKQALWSVLAKQIGITDEQCAHRFRNLKQVYTNYVQREINKPEIAIFWPYYALCKKVFGYRAIKSKLKNSKPESEEVVEWSAREIKKLINYYGLHKEEMIHDDVSNWKEIAEELQKSPQAVREKFNELRKAYRRLKTVRDHNPDYKVTWKYFNMFDQLYEKTDVIQEEIEENVYESQERDEDDEDYHIIVIPEESDINDISDSQIVIQENDTTEYVENQLENVQEQRALIKWNKKTKRKLLILYLNYVKAKKGQEIKPQEMWAEIASKMSGKSPVMCRKMFVKLKIQHLRKKDLGEPNNKNAFTTLLDKILTLKARFSKPEQNALKDREVYKDVELPADKVELALEYYLQNIDDFISPKFEKKFVWGELAKHVDVPVNKIFNKINYLKQNYDSDSEGVYGELLKKIVAKELAAKAEASVQVVLEHEEDVDWLDAETEQLLIWYLTNLEKFKNPKFVRKYLWSEVSSVLGKTPLACSKKMIEVRTQYKTMIKENPDDLINWRFYELCQKIYGTGKKSEAIAMEQGE